MPPRLAGRVDFDPRTYLGDGNLRPLDRTGRLAVAASGLALDAAGWTAEERAETEVGLVLGTMFGSVHTISEFDRRAMEAGPNYAKPMEFANSVINAAAGQTAIWHDLWGINATISGGTASGAQAIAYAGGSHPQRPGGGAAGRRRRRAVLRGCLRLRSRRPALRSRRRRRRARRRPTTPGAPASPWPRRAFS